MNLIVDDRIQKKYFYPTPEGFLRTINDINQIVIHGSGGGASSQALINWLLTDEEHGKLLRQGEGLFHYTIDLNGDIYNILPADVWCYHSDAGLYDKRSIGIEMVNIGVENSAGYTDEQYKALQDLIVTLCQDAPSINSIVSHDANRRMISNMGPKPCPGSLFDWMKIEEVITGRINQTITVIRA